MATLNIRNLDDEAYRKIKVGAAREGLTIAKYLEKLVKGAK